MTTETHNLTPCNLGKSRNLLTRLFISSLKDEGREVEAAVDEVRRSLKQPGISPLWRVWIRPLARHHGCWLERVVTMTNAHTGLGAGLLNLQRVFFEESGFGDRRFFSMAVAEGPLPEDAHWLLALAQEGACFPAAVVGVTLAHAELGGGLFSLERAVSYRRTLVLANRLLANWFQGGDAWKQAMSARALYRRSTLGWCRAWLAETPLEQRLLEMFRSKAKYGQGYHGKIEIGGRCLDDWLGELAMGGGRDFLRCFRESSYVDRQHPEDSRFLRHSTAFGGPMFGVFSESDQALLRCWFQSPSADASNMEQQIRPEQQDRGDARYLPSVSGTPPVARPARRLKPPELYHSLLNGIDPHAALPAARLWVERILGRAHWLRKGYFSFHPKLFRAYIDRLHEEACRERATSRNRWSLSRETYIWGIEQFAPAILVDGSWLQSSLPLARQLPEVGEALWRIWRDELGDGDMTRHHGNLYRSLLESVGVHLPPFDSEDFILHPGFVTGAFDLPAFLLAIGRFPEYYLPEILGLNLAIELSGLGHNYQELAEGMEAVGLDSTIVRLHQSIDNLACGHAALARDAIIAYLQRFEPGGEAAVQNQWRRVWTGWQALTPASWRFTIHLLAGWGRRFASAVIRERSLCL